MGSSGNGKPERTVSEELSYQLGENTNEHVDVQVSPQKVEHSGVQEGEVRRGEG